MVAKVRKWVRQSKQILKFIDSQLFAVFPLGLPQQPTFQIKTRIIKKFSDSVQKSPAIQILSQTHTDLIFPFWKNASIDNLVFVFESFNVIDLTYSDGFSLELALIEETSRESKFCRSATSNQKRHQLCWWRNFCAAERWGDSLDSFCQEVHFLATYNPHLLVIWLWSSFWSAVALFA